MPRKLSKPWLDSWQDFQVNSRAPRQYIFWSGVGAIASVLKRNVYIPWGQYTVYPNQYIILVGPPGIGKGEAINPIVDLLHDTGDLAHLLEDRVSPEKVIVRLDAGWPVMRVQGNQLIASKDHVATIIATELNSYLSMSDWVFTMMCDAWDKGRVSYDTKHKGSYYVKDCCLSLLAGCVPEYIREINKEAMSAIATGFTARCIFVYATQQGRDIDWPDDIPSPPKLRDLLMEDLKSIGQLKGNFRFTQHAKDYWKLFHAKVRDQIKSEDFATDAVRHFLTRIETHVLKIAMILCVSEDDRMVIDRRHFENAVMYAEDVLNKLDVTFRAVGESDLAEATDRVMRYVEKQGITTRGKLLKDNWRHFTDDQLEKILKVLEHMGFLRVDYQGSKILITHVNKMTISAKAEAKDRIEIP